MRAFYTDHFVLPLPDGHRFPMAKYARLREALMASAAPTLSLLVPEAATTEQLCRVHDDDYVRRVSDGSLGCWPVVATVGGFAHGRRQIPGRH